MIHEFQENLAIVGCQLNLDIGYSGDVGRNGDGWGDSDNSRLMHTRTGDGVGENADTVDCMHMLVNQIARGGKMWVGDGAGSGISIDSSGDGRGEGL
jgi:hypothetical protein